MEKLNKLGIHKPAFVILVVTILTLGLSATLFAQIPPQVPIGKGMSPKPLIQQYARFVSNDSELILWGDDDGVKLYNLETKKILAVELKGQQITALKVNPADMNTAIAATSAGKVYSVTITENTITSHLIQDLSQGDVGVIRQILFYQIDPENVIASDNWKVYRSTDSGMSWDVEAPYIMPDTNKLVITLMESLDFPDKFLVSTTNDGRYLGDWDGYKLESIPEEAVPHGHSIHRGAISFIPMGNNSKYFGFNYLKIQVIDSITCRTESGTVVFCAGVGYSPIKVSKERRRVRVDFINPRAKMAYSIDVRPENTLHQLLATNSDVFLTTNGGDDWQNIQ